MNAEETFREMEHQHALHEGRAAFHPLRYIQARVTFNDLAEAHLLLLDEMFEQ